MGVRLVGEEERGSSTIEGTLDAKLEKQTMTTIIKFTLY